MISSKGQWSRSSSVPPKWRSWRTLFPSDVGNIWWFPHQMSTSKPLCGHVEVSIVMGLPPYLDGFYWKMPSRNGWWLGGSPMTQESSTWIMIISMCMPCMHQKPGKLVWLVVWLPSILFSQKYWECHHPNWRTHIFQRVAQPPTSGVHSRVDASSAGSHFSKLRWAWHLWKNCVFLSDLCDFTSK